MGPEYIPDYYHDQGDFKGEWYDRESLGFYRSIKAGLDMGIVNQIPVREGLSSTLKPNHLRNPHDLLQKAIEDNNEQRHYQLNGHNKQHLFGKGNQSMISPRKQEFYKDTNFEMENEVYPTEFIKKKNAQLGNNCETERIFKGIKHYKDNEIQPYMKEKVGETIQAENVAKYHFPNTNHRQQYNQSLLSSHRSLQKEEINQTQFSQCDLRSKAGDAVKGVHYRPYEWKYAHDKVDDEDDTDITKPHKKNSPFSDKHYMPGTTMRRRTDNISLPTLKINQVSYENSHYEKPEHSERAQKAVMELRSQRALQKSGSDIALSTMSNDLTSRGGYDQIPSSVPSIAKTLRSNSYKLLPPQTEYYYQSKFKNVGRFKAFDKEHESESSDEDHQPTVIPNDKYLGHTMKI
ncbi:unnamed protein product [Moneuplotes crassus]|uniref:Uncharacterized protein n=3 Tax=Euplotes crassus TaxID=5936 RepID=A0AAD1XC75_EUPCR|nr:unnamed protein product [Moneuplotes crassus]